jgi:hypothetical protein
VSETRTPPWLRLSPVEEYDRIRAARLHHLVEIRQPFVLVSQIQRSGGTLLSQLFDGHPEVHAHPEEVKIGYPRKSEWPPIDPARPVEAFARLYEQAVAEDLVRGYVKGQRADDVFPFLFSPRLQWEIFEAVVSSWPAGAERDVLDAYFTSYFNAWLDNHNLYTGPKRVVTGFTPRLAMRPTNVESFFSAYPDGFLLSIVRDPRSWFASASGHSEKYADFDRSMELWRRSTEATLAAAKRHRERVIVLTYDELVLETEPVMRSVAERVGITFHPVLLMPTFNGRPIRANSHHEVAGFGVLGDRARMYRSLLEPETIARIERVAGDLYERVQAAAGRP